MRISESPLQMGNVGIPPSRPLDSNAYISKNKLQPVESTRFHTTSVSSHQHQEDVERSLQTASRRARALRKINRKLSPSKAERSCGIACLGGFVDVVCSTTGTISKRYGVASCSSQACPSCAAASKIKLINRMVPALVGASMVGKKIFMLTLTLRHSRSTKAKRLLQDFSKGWNRVNSSIKYHLKDGQPIEWLRHRDYTWGWSSGHHFHQAILLCLPVGTTTASIATLEEVIWSAWIRFSVAAGYGTPSREGFDFRLVSAGTNSIVSVSRYLTKLTKSAFELVGDVWKEGRGSNLSAWGMLETIHKSKSGAFRSSLEEEYKEYRNAIHGKRAWSASKGFFKQADLTPPEVELPEEEMDPDKAIPDPLEVLSKSLLDEDYEWRLFRVHPDIWKGLCRHGATEFIQNLLEDGSAKRLVKSWDLMMFQSFKALIENALHGSKSQRQPEVIARSYDEWAKTYLKGVS